jgi:hypothetical protein
VTAGADRVTSGLHTGSGNDFGPFMSSFFGFTRVKSAEIAVVLRHDTVGHRSLPGSKPLANYDGCESICETKQVPERRLSHLVEKLVVDEAECHG